MKTTILASAALLALALGGCRHQKVEVEADDDHDRPMVIEKERVIERPGPTTVIERDDPDVIIERR
jgi:hypothetical protein